MPLPQLWADKLIAKLLFAYGAEFERLYANQTWTEVKAAWADILDGFEHRPSAITWALENLPERPPNAIAFRNLCRSAPQPAGALQILPPKADPQKVAEIVASVRIGLPANPSVSPAQSVIDGIIEILTKKTETPNRAQRQFVERCVTMLASTDPRRATLRTLGFKVDVAKAEEVAA